MWWRILEAADREKIFMGNACIMPVLQGDFVNGNFLHSVFAASIIKDKKDRRGSMEQRYTVTRAAEILGVRASVLRYWEEELDLHINRNEQGHRYYTGYDITLLANIKELKKRGLALRAIKELIPRISRTAPGTTASKVKLLEDEQPEREKILEFQKIMERLIAQELHMKKEGEDQCRDLDETIRNRQLARKEAAAALEKRSRRIRRKHL